MLHMIVDIDLDRLDIVVAIGLARQRSQCMLIELFEGIATVTLQLFGFCLLC
jgi:hypothetical protein